jgi:hypothetical protein
MAQKRKEESEFKVSDRRLFTADGELRGDAEEQDAKSQESRSQDSTTRESKSQELKSTTAESAAAQTFPESASKVAAPPDADGPAPPSAIEQDAQNEAYKQSARDLDSRIEQGGHSAKELEVSFERFMASLYMTAMMQLGLMHQRDEQPMVDIIGARQTIDTLGMLGEKTKGNLTPKEQGFLQNCLYELRMAYVEVTNALARPPQNAGSVTGTNG